MKYLLIIILWLLYLPQGVTQDSYQVLRGESQGFAQVLPGKTLKFPDDHQSHPEFRIEWWYFTANLKDGEGQVWGLQWTLFRQALDANADLEGWDSNQLWMAHAAISSPRGHRFEQRFARGGTGQAGVEARDSFNAWLDDWQWLATGASMFPAQLDFTVAEQRVSVRLESSSDWVLHGNQGYSQKSAQGQASYYYSQPDVAVSGTILVDSEEVTLTGNGWLDREWSSQPLAKNQSGWDWFSLHLADGNKLMLYRLREDDGGGWLSGSWINASGKILQLEASDIKLVEQSRRTIQIDTETTLELPLEWSIHLPGLNRKLRVKPLYDQQWMNTKFSYWEGVVLVEDASGQPVGEGYMELTGYD
jgi:predicted secreted hydrolase